MPEDLTAVSTTFVDPVTVPIDSDTRNAQSVKTSFQQLADRTAYLKRQLAPDAGAGETHPSRRVMARATSLRAWPENAGPTDEWERTTAELTDGELVSLGDLVQLTWELNDVMPSGAELKRVDALVIPGGASRTQEIGLEVFKTSHDPFTPGLTRSNSSLGSDSDNGTTSEQVLTVASIDEFLDKETEAMSVVITAGIPHSGDTIIAVWATFTDPGPRNY